MSVIGFSKASSSVNAKVVLGGQYKEIGKRISVPSSSRNKVPSVKPRVMRYRMVDNFNVTGGVNDTIKKDRYFDGIWVGLIIGLLLAVANTVIAVIV